MKRDWFGELGSMPGLLAESEMRRRGLGFLAPFLREASDSEWIPAVELESRQRMRLRALARHAFRFSPEFAVRVAASGMGAEELGDPGALQQLKPIGRGDVMRAGEGFYCREVPTDHGGIGESITSGSTGEPVVIRRTERARLYWLVAGLRERLWLGRGCCGRLAVVRANAGKAEEYDEWGPPYSMLFKTGTASVRPASTSVEALASWLEAGGFDEWVMLPSCLSGVLECLGRAGVSVRPPAVVRTLSETVSGDLRQEVRSRFGLEIQDSYSSQEFGVIAIQCPGGGSYHVLEHLIVEVVDEQGSPCAPGQIGRVLVTDLVNLAAPMIRYDIGDLAEVGAPCACGLPHRSLKRILGRERNLLRMPDGSRRWPVFGFHAWREIGPVRQFQFVQTGAEELLARLRVDRVPEAGEQDQLRERIRMGFGHPFEIRFEWHFAPLPRGKGGKFEEFVQGLPVKDA